MLKVGNEVFENLHDRVALQMATLPLPISQRIAASTSPRSPPEGLPASRTSHGKVCTAMPPRRRRRRLPTYQLAAGRPPFRR